MKEDSPELKARLQKLCIRLGTSTEFLSQFAFVFERSGVAFEQGSLGLQGMSRRLADAAAGSGTAGDALQELGISAQEVANLPLRDQFLLISEALSGVQNASRRTALAQKIFGRSGVELLQRRWCRASAAGGRQR